MKQPVSRVLCIVMLGVYSVYVSAASAAALTYSRHCASCHGKELEGAVGPSLIKSEWRAVGARKNLIKTIHDGRPALGMPAWGGALSGEEIEGVADEIQRVNSRVGQLKVETRPPGIVKGQLYDIRVEVLADTDYLKIAPSSMAFLPNGDLLLAGSTDLNLLRKGAGNVSPIPGIGAPRVTSVALHPDYHDNGWIYLSLGSDSKSPSGQLIRGRIRSGRWVDGEVLGPYGGPRIVFDNKGFLYISEGVVEQAHQDEIEVQEVDSVCQDLTKSGGKILRLRDDGSIPDDNPFVAQPGARGEIWTFGHRDPEGLTFDAVTQTLWSTEHGPWGGDELNRIMKGRNYGYPIVSSGRHYSALLPFARYHEGIDDPVFHWTPSIGVSNLVVYRGAAFPKWEGNLLVTSLGSPRVGRTLYRFNLVDGQAVLFSLARDSSGRALKDSSGQPMPPTRRYEELLPGIGRIRDISVSSEGYVYLLLERPGKVVRIVPVSPATTTLPAFDFLLP